MQLPPLPGKKCQRGTEMGRDEFRAPQGQKQQAEEGESWSRLKRKKAGHGHGAEGDKEGASKSRQSRARYNVQGSVGSPGHQSCPKLWPTAGGHEVGGQRAAEVKLQSDGIQNHM